MQEERRADEKQECIPPAAHARAVAEHSDKRRDDGDRGVNPARRRDGDDAHVYRSERPYSEEGRDGEGRDFKRRRTFTFHGPMLGEDKERPVFKGRRNGWKRRDASTSDAGEETKE